MQKVLIGCTCQRHIACTLVVRSVFVVLFALLAFYHDTEDLQVAGNHLCQPVSSQCEFFLQSMYTA
jgi:hypothetical protein